MIKKLIVIVIVGILASTCTTSATFGKPTKAYIQHTQPILRYPDEIDQKQETYVDGIVLPVGTLTFMNTTVNVQVAQSFIPQKEVITRIELFIGKNTTTTYPYSVGIRENLSGENLVETNVNAADITTQSFSWVQFDIPDVLVTIGQTYYIVCYTQNMPDNWYFWGANNDSTSYALGCAWISLDGNNWSNQSKTFNLHTEHSNTPIPDETPTWDLCFKTYGLDGTTLQISLTGIIFPTITIRNIGAVTAYDVEWNADVHSSFFSKNYHGSISELPPNATILVKLPLIGLGKIKINATAWAANAPMVSLNVQGFLLLILFIRK